MIHLYLRLTQKFVGGALSSLAGMQSFYTEAYAKYNAKKNTINTKIYNFKKKANYMFGSEANLLNKSLTYGVQNVATNFAYMDRKYFTDNYGLKQLPSFVVGFINGAAQFAIFKNGKKHAVRFAVSSFVYWNDYKWNTLINIDYSPFNYYDKKSKYRIFSLKAFVFTY